MTKTFKIINNGKQIGQIKGSIYSEDGAKYIGLGDFEIYPEYQNKGYGTKALKELISKLKLDYDLIYCYVDKNNDRAVHIYSKLGRIKDTGEQFMCVFYDKTGEYSTYNRLNDAE